MPATKNAMTRYQILDELLANRYKNFSLDELTEEVCNKLSELDPDTNGVTRRCIEKDIQYLEYESPFLVEIERYSVQSYDHDKERYYTKRCLRYADPSFSIFKKELSKEEKYLLKEAMRLLGQFNGLPMLDALEQLRINLSTEVTERKIISFADNAIENRNVLGELFVCILHEQVVELTYHRFGADPSPRQAKVYPYLLKEYNNRWFLFAAACSDLKLLCFALDRIDQVKALPAEKYVPCKTNLSERFNNIIGVTLYDNEAVLHIVFWVTDFEKEYVLTKPLHHSQVLLSGEAELLYRQQYPHLQGGAFFSIDCVRNYELLRELCSYGADLLVLSPASIQQEIHNRVEQMCDKYKGIAHSSEK